MLRCYETTAVMKRQYPPFNKQKHTYKNTAVKKKVEALKRYLPLEIQDVCMAASPAYMHLMHTH